MITEEPKIKDNKLENELLPKDLSIYLVKDRWSWAYNGLDSNDLYEQDFDSPLDAVCDFTRTILASQQKTQSFYRVMEDFKDTLNQVMEEQPYDDGVMDLIDDLHEALIDVMANDL